MPLQLLKPTLAPLTLRLGLAVILLYHGLLKLSDRGGSGWTDNPNIPPIAQMAITWVEIVSGLAIALGALTRPAAFAIAIIQIGAIVLVTGHYDFIRIQRLGPGESQYRFGDVGWEYNFSLLIMCVTLMMLGSGTWSVNNIFVSWFRQKRTTGGPGDSLAPPLAATGDVPAPEPR